MLTRAARRCYSAVAVESVKRLVAAPVFPVGEFRTRLGEGVSWDDEAGLLRFVDLLDRKVFAYDPERHKLSSWEWPEELGTVVSTTDPETLLLGSASGFFLAKLRDTMRHELQWLGPFGMDAIDRSLGGRLNDGRCDRQGRLVCGGYNMPLDDAFPRRHGVFQVRQDRSVRRMPVFGDVGCTNGICFSVDGTRMYFTDTWDGVEGTFNGLRVYDYDPATGDASRPREFVDLKALGLPGYVDGATVDAEDGVWVAGVTAGLVYRFLPDGTLDTVVEVPGSLMLACPAIGGRDMDTLFLACIGDGSQNALCEPGRENGQRGGLFSVKIPQRGVPEPKFKM